MARPPAPPVTSITLPRAPFFDQAQTTASVTFGRWNTGGTGYGRIVDQLDTGGPLIKDKLAFRVSIQREDSLDSKQYYKGIAGPAFTDIYATAGWVANKQLSVDWNVDYKSTRTGPILGINRVTQNLIDNHTYEAGEAVPIISFGGGYYKPNASGGWDQGTIANGVFTVTKAQAATTLGSQKSPGSISGWVINPGNAQKVGHNLSLYNPGYQEGGNAKEAIFQQRATLVISDDVTIKNNLVGQYQRVTAEQYDIYQARRYNDLFVDRTEVIVNKEYNFFGIPIEHQSNSGLEFRWAWSECTANMFSGYNTSFDATDPNSVSINAATQAQWTPNPIVPGLSAVTKNDVYPTTPVYSTYGAWLKAPVTYDTGKFLTGLGIYPTDSADRTHNYVSPSIYSSHVFKISEKFSWLIGGRLTAIWDKIRPSETTSSIINQGLLPNYTFTDSQFHVNDDWNTSLSYKVAKWATAYVTYDHDSAPTDCQCGVSQNYSAGNKDVGSYYHTLSKLYEAGARFEFIPRKLYGSLTGYYQSRFIASPTQIPADSRYRGVEASLNYQPGKSFLLGGNYSYIQANYHNAGNPSSTAAPWGIIADGSTIIGPSGLAGYTARGNWRISGIPLQTVNLFADYRFSSGFGLKAGFWATSKWNVSYLGDAVVPAQYEVDLAGYYEHKRWRVQVDVFNVTNQYNWTTAGEGSVLGAEPLGVQGKITVRL
jgi:iron complex outermembrane receptor protein